MRRVVALMAIAAWIAGLLYAVPADAHALADAGCAALLLR